jgi:hypothetical protein
LIDIIEDEDDWRWLSRNKIKALRDPRIYKKKLWDRGTIRRRD